MRAGQNTHFRHDGAYGDKITPIDTQAGLEHRGTHNVCFKVFEHWLGSVCIQLFCGQFLNNGCFCSRNFFVAGLFHLFLVSISNQLAANFVYAGAQFLSFFGFFWQVPRCFCSVFSQRNNGFNNRLERVVAKGHRFKHDFFRQLGSF